MGGGAIKDDVRIPELDGVRGWAILSVIVFHYATVGRSPAETAPWFLAPVWILWSGVDLFFVLSGFLIGGILLDRRDSPNYFKVFYLRRTLRIFPLYYAVIVLSIVCSATPWLRDGPAGTFLCENNHSHWWYVVFQQNHVELFTGERAVPAAFLGPMWSLAIEEHFYLALPFIVHFFPRRWIPYICCLGIVAGPVGRLLAEGRGAYFYTWCRMDALCLGVLIATVLREPVICAAVRRHAGWLLAGMSAIVAGTIWYAFTHTWVPGVGFGSVVGHTCLACFYGLLVTVCVVRSNTKMTAVFRSRFLRGLGTVSYGMYLLHMPVLGFTHLVLRAQSPSLNEIGDLLAHALAAALCWAVACFSYRRFESRLIGWGRRFRYSTGQSP